MPLDDSDPSGTTYVYTLVKYPKGDYILVLYSGDIEMGDFAMAIERVLHNMVYLKGATGRCHMLQFKSRRALNKVALSFSCFYCGEMGRDFQKCQGCSFARYCSRECQRLHWRGCHKQACVQLDFDHRGGRNRNLQLWYGIVNGYDFNLWIHLAR
jgi:hypothetical protein